MLTEVLRPDVTAQLDFYVYRLIDPAGNTFYVGEGSGDRVHQHRGKSNFPAVYEERIVRYGMTKDEALRLEAALIAVLGLENLDNKVQGHGGTDTDLRTDTLQARLGAAPFDVSSIPDGILIVQVRSGVYYPYPGAKPCPLPGFDDVAAQGEAALMERVRGDWTCSRDTAHRVRQIAVADGSNVIRRVYDVSDPVLVTHAQNGELYVVATGKKKGTPRARWRFCTISTASQPSPIVGTRLVFPDGKDAISNQWPCNKSWALREKAAGMHPVLVVASPFE